MQTENTPRIEHMGPLKGLRMVEIVGLGPGPFAAMLLADLGADIVRIDRKDRVRPGLVGAPSLDLLARGRPSIGVDLKHPEGVAAVLRLVAGADALIEGFRPGVMERLGLGPDACFAQNPRLVYGRMTGFGQEGPLKDRAGHDINYIALSGALHAIGRQGEKPLAPLNLVGDFGGGSLFLALGIMCALYETARSGKGQVVDAAMVDGASLLMTMSHSMQAMGVQSTERGANLLDSGAPFYETYETADQKFISIGAIEPQFYAELLQRLGLSAETLPRQSDRASWPAMKERFAALFKQRTRAAWELVFEGSDACFAPVLDMNEATANPHMLARRAFITVAGVPQPAPAPRFSRSGLAEPTPPAQPGRDTDSALSAWGFSPTEIAELRGAGAIA
jgi:alpha-methylacyl-CoA racemase